MNRLLKSFQFAGQGIWHCVAKEKNFQIHCVSAVMAVITGFLLKISQTEWMVCLICIAFVLAFEMINTAIEHLCNLVNPAYSPLVKIIKDVSAAAVIIVALMAVICGGIIFIPKIILFIQNT